MGKKWNFVEWGRGEASGRGEGVDGGGVTEGRAEKARESSKKGEERWTGERLEREVKVEMVAWPKRRL